MFALKCHLYTNCRIIGITSCMSNVVVCPFTDLRSSRGPLRVVWFVPTAVLIFTLSCFTPYAEIGVLPRIKFSFPIQSLVPCGAVSGLGTPIEDLIYDWLPPGSRFLTSPDISIFLKTPLVDAGHMVALSR